MSDDTVKIQTFKAHVESVTNQVQQGANTKGIRQQLSNGLSELESMKNNIQEGITKYNSKFVDHGENGVHQQDKALYKALEHGLSELETVRRKIMESMASMHTGAIPGAPIESARNVISGEEKEKKTTREAHEHSRKDFVSKQRRKSELAKTQSEREKKETWLQMRSLRQQHLNQQKKVLPNLGAQSTTSTVRKSEAPQPPVETQSTSTHSRARPSSAPAQRRTPVPTPTAQPAQEQNSVINEEWAQAVLQRLRSRQRYSTPSEEIKPPNATHQPMNAPTQSTAQVPNQTTQVPQKSVSRPSSAGGITSRRASKGSSLEAPVQALRERGNTLFQEKRYGEACAAYTKAIEMDSQSETLYCNRAATYLMMRKYHEALQDAIHVIEIDPNHVKGHWRAGKAHLYLGTFEHARTFYTTARRVATSAQDADAIEAEAKVIDWVERCRRCLRTREWKEALQLAENILCVLPAGTPCNTPWECLRIEAMIHVDPQQASSLAQRLCTEEPNYPESWFLRSKALFYCSHDAVSTATALSYLQKCSSLEENGAKHVRAATLQTCIETFSRLRDEGNQAYANGQWGEAHAAYTKALSLDPCNASLRGITLCNRAAVHIQAERWKEGLDDITQSIQLNPLNAKAFARRARIFQHFGQHDDAVRDLQQAVKLYPSAENQERLAQALDLLKNGGNPNFDSANNVPPQRTNSTTRPQQTQQQRPQSAGGFGRSQSNPNMRPRSASNSIPSSNSAADLKKAANQAPTFYDILGVAKNVDDRTLTKMYREAALKWHPDKWVSFEESQRNQAEDNFKQISQAYSTLRDPVRRRQYDLTV